MGLPLIAQHRTSGRFDIGTRQRRTQRPLPIAQLAKESATGQTMDYDYILNSVKSTIDIVAFFDKTYMTELYFDPVEKFYAMRGRL